MMLRPVAQTLATTIVWTATMVIFTKGIFTVNYHDHAALQFGAFTVAMVMIAATVSTVVIWRSAGDVATPTSAPAKVVTEDEWAQV